MQAGTRDDEDAGNASAKKARKAKRREGRKDSVKTLDDSEYESSKAVAQQDSMKLPPNRVSHAQRFHKRVRNKLVSGYSTADLSAILGERINEQVLPSFPQTCTSRHSDAAIASHCMSDRCLNR